MKILECRKCIYYSVDLEGNEECGEMGINITKQIKNEEKYFSEYCKLESIDNCKVIHK